eukprot:scaffold140738_cov31-Tisochrysis_lutea.AAC.3
MPRARKLVIEDRLDVSTSPRNPETMGTLEEESADSSVVSSMVAADTISSETGSRIMSVGAAGGENSV